MTDLKNFAPSRLRVNDLLEQHFDTAFAAPDGIKKLRELILTLAMQGKLVAQDPNDPPASELLKQIEAEKERISREGAKTRRKEKKLLPIKPEEVPYELPQGWEWVRLNDALDVRDGTHDTPKYVDVGYPLVTSKNIYTGTLSLEDVKYISKEDHEKIAERSKVDSGDILFAMIGSIGNPVIVDADVEFSIKNVALFKYFMDGKPSNRYLHYYLIHAQDNMKAISSGAVQSFVSLGFLRNYPFPLPPLPEQHRIVERIDQLMARCDELEKLRTEREEKRLAVHAAAIKQLLDPSSLNLRGFVPSCETNPFDFLAQHFGELYTVKENVAELRKAILQLAVMGRLVEQNPNDPPASELLKQIDAEKQRLIKEKKIKKPKPLPPIKAEEVPYELPQGWEWVRLDELTQVITKGSSPKWQGVDYVNEGEGILFITSENVGAFELLIEKKKYVEEKFNNIEPRSILKKCDILMNIVGASIGRTAIFDLDETANINQAVTIIRLIEKLDHQYFLKFFNSPICLSYMFDKQVDNARPNLSMGNIARFAIPLPPLPEQQRIVARIDQLMALCDTLDQQIDAATDKQTELLNAVMAQV